MIYRITSHRFNFLVVCVALATTLYGQQFKELPAKLVWGKEIREPSGTFTSKIVGTDASGFYTLRQKTQVSSSVNNPKIYVEYYSNRMTLRKSKEISLKYKNKKREFENLLKVGDQLFLITSFNNQKQEKNYLFVQTINEKNLQARDDLRKIAEIPTKNAFKIGSYGFHLSRDSSRILVYNKLPYKKGTPERFALQVFDQSFNELWRKDIALPYNDERFSLEEYRVDRDGNVYLLGVIFQDRIRVRRNGRPTYQYVVLAYTQSGEDVEEYKVQLEDKFITDLTFRVANNGDLVCSGFYSERGTYSIKGTYFFRLNAQTKEIYNQNYKAFGFDFLTEYKTDRQKDRLRRAEERGNRKREPELYRFSLDELVLRSDGGAVLIAEQYYVYTVSYRDYYSYYNTSLQYDYYYNYNDIIVVNIRPSGEIEWTCRIPKRQETYNDGGYFSSYAMSIVRDKMFFVYNDNGRNFDPGSERLYNFNGRNSVIALTEVNRDGSAHTYPLYNNRDAEIITRPKICKQIGRKEMLVYGERGRSYRFASLSFE